MKRVKEASNSSMDSKDKFTKSIDDVKQKVMTQTLQQISLYR